jgi:hypothetical protein
LEKQLLSYFISNYIYCIKVILIIYIFYFGIVIAFHPRLWQRHKRVFKVYFLPFIKSIKQELNLKEKNYIILLKNFLRFYVLIHLFLGILLPTKVFCRSDEINIPVQIFSFFIAFTLIISYYGFPLFFIFFLLFCLSFFFEAIFFAEMYVRNESLVVNILFDSSKQRVKRIVNFYMGNPSSRIYYLVGSSLKVIVGGAAIAQCEDFWINSLVTEELSNIANLEKSKEIINQKFDTKIEELRNKEFSSEDIKKVMNDFKDEINCARQNEHDVYKHHKEILMREKAFFNPFIKKSIGLIKDFNNSGAPTEGGFKVTSGNGGSFEGNFKRTPLDQEA